jgi:hypothetical protein
MKGLAAVVVAALIILRVVCSASGWLPAGASRRLVRITNRGCNWITKYTKSSNYASVGWGPGRLMAAGCYSDIIEKVPTRLDAGDDFPGEGQ